MRHANFRCKCNLDRKTAKHTRRTKEKTRKPSHLIRVDLLQPRTALVQRPVDRRGDRQGAADDGADADEEAGEGL